MAMYLRCTVPEKVALRTVLLMARVAAKAAEVGEPVTGAQQQANRPVPLDASVVACWG